MSIHVRHSLVALVLLLVIPMVASAQNPAAAAETPSPELVSRLTKKLAITPEQAIGGAGAIFGLAKTRLSPDDFGKVSAAVPGMDGFLKAAPQQSAVPSAAGALGAALPGGAGGAATNAMGLASLAGPFKSLGLSPDMAMKMVPLLTNFVGRRGGASTGSLLGGVLK